GRDGGAAADSDGHPGAWLTVVLDDGNARNAALDEILRCGDLAHVGIGHAHRCHRAGDVTPALRTVPHDDHVFEFSDALAQGNIDDPLITYGNLLCLEADERKDEHGIGPRDRDGVITIQVRGRTDLGSLNGDVHSRKREARFSLRNATFDVDLLSSRYRSPKHHESAQAQIYSSVLGHSDEDFGRSEEHTSELQSRENLVCRLLLEKKKIFNLLAGGIHTAIALIRSALGSCGSTGRGVACQHITRSCTTQPLIAHRSFSSSRSWCQS